MGKTKLDADVDELFKVPLAEFTGVRNALAARLKKEGRVEDANRIKALSKPSVSAWAVNQLYWNQHDAFDRLLEAGERLRQAQASQLAGKTADIREPRDARRDALAELSRRAAALLTEAGHNASPETMRRITTNLEAISAYAALPDSPPPGRLTEDIDPPGFEALAALMTGAGVKPRTPPSAVMPAVKKKGIDEDNTAAKRALHSAERMLSDAQARADRLEARMKKAAIELKEAERTRRDAEERFIKASAAVEAAAEQARNLADEAERAAHAVDEAARAVEKAKKHLS
jgi:hypothetical protein